MRHLITFIQKRYLVTVSLIAILVSLPGLFIDWSFVDDGVTVMISQKINDAIFHQKNLLSLLSLLIEPENGRVRSFYWILQWFFWLISENSSFLRHLYLLLMVLGVSVISAWLIYRTMKSKLVAVFVLSIWLINSGNSENWYRLGPQEIPLILLLLSSLALLLYSVNFFESNGKKRRAYFLFSLPLIPMAFYTKEVGVGYFGVVTLTIWILMVLKPFKHINWTRVWIYAGVALLSAVSIILSLIYVSGLRSGTYSAFYSINHSSIISGFKIYFTSLVKSAYPLSYIGIFGILIWAFFYKKKKTEFFWIFFWIIWTVVFLAIQIPWGIPLPRYLLLASFGASIITVVGINKLINFVRLNFSPKIYFLFILALVVVSVRYVLYQSQDIYNYLETQIVGTNVSQDLLRYLALNMHKDDRLIMNFPKNDTYLELVFETGLHLKTFSGRSDIELAYVQDVDKISHSDWMIGLKPYENIPIITQYPQKQSFFRINFFDIKQSQGIVRSILSLKNWTQIDTWYVQKK